MTLKGLRSWVESQQQTTTEQDQELNRLKSKLSNHTGDGYKKFYLWHESTHEVRYKNSKGQCCYWHIIGAPTLKRDGRDVDMPALPYQQLLWNFLNEHKRIWIKKSRGIGVTEFLLRWIGYNCLTGGFPAGSRVCIVTGPRINLAEDLVSNRFKGLFSKVAPNLFDRSRSTIATLNGVKVEAFPSHHVDTMRGLDNVKFIMSDESDFYPAFQQQSMRAVAEGFIGKPNSDTHILLVSTPNAPGGLFQKIEQEKDSLYYKVFLDYRYGLEGQYPIYSQAMLNEAMKSPEWGREYEGRYLGVSGGVFSQLSIENATKIEYNPYFIVPEAPKSIGLDPAWGSSNFAIVATQYLGGKIQVIFADEYPRPFFQFMIDKVFELKQRLGHVTNIYCDSANPEIIQELKRNVNESYDNQYVKEKIAWCKKNKVLVEDCMIIVPISFATDGPSMLQHLKHILERPVPVLAIHPRFDKLLISLRTATATEMKLNKEDTSYDDLLDAMRMAIWYYKFRS